jgi:NAD dependent epimerase/dehydratase family enzyme
MRSVVTEASGVIGRELLQLPAELDHQVMAQTRSTAEDEI